MNYTTRPLSDKAWMTPAGRREPSRFGPRSGQSHGRWWGGTMRLLATELDALKAKHIVLGVDVEPRMIRLDGMLYANARPASPAVELAFESMHGPMLYRCDRFTGSAPAYQHNVRAIALTLENLRAVDRYGATSSGQQYTGYLQIEAAHIALPSAVERGNAWGTLQELANRSSGGRRAVTDDQVITHARRNAHPDTGGTEELWLRFTDALKVARA